MCRIVNPSSTTILSLFLSLVAMHDLSQGEPLPLTGQSADALAPLDQAMRELLTQNDVPGAALAVARGGRIVYARGFGYADAEAREPDGRCSPRVVEPTSLFRIASLSKPITAVAVLRMVDRGELSLDDRVFELLPHEPAASRREWPAAARREWPAAPRRESLPGEPKPAMDERLNRVTVRDLLQHSGGWDSNIATDPMFHPVKIADVLDVPPPAGPSEIIRFMLGWPLDFDPGTRMAYSNFGYCVLGRVIEQVAGCGYEEHVRRDVLRPLGITSMRIGRTLPEGRAEGEVRYYTQNNRVGLSVMAEQLGARVPCPYGTWYLEAMDAHGGWIASAVDLATFASAVQRHGETKLISSGVFEEMVRRPPYAPDTSVPGEVPTGYYGLGWAVTPVADGSPCDKAAPAFDLSHNGLLDGTSSVLIIRHDGLCIAVLLNTNQGKDGQPLYRPTRAALDAAISNIDDWP
jgi:N-acyl-D-amino-acid deacylase